MLFINLHLNFSLWNSLRSIFTDDVDKNNKQIDFGMIGPSSDFFKKKAILEEKAKTHTTLKQPETKKSDSTITKKSVQKINQTYKDNSPVGFHATPYDHKHDFKDNSPTSIVKPASDPEIKHQDNAPKGDLDPIKVEIEHKKNSPAHSDYPHDLGLKFDAALNFKAPKDDLLKPQDVKRSAPDNNLVASAGRIFNSIATDGKIMMGDGLVNEEKDKDKKASPDLTIASPQDIKITHKDNSPKTESVKPQNIHRRTVSTTDNDLIENVRTNDYSMRSFDNASSLKDQALILKSKVDSLAVQDENLEDNYNKTKKKVMDKQNNQSSKIELQKNELDNLQNSQLKLSQKEVDVENENEDISFKNNQLKEKIADLQSKQKDTKEDINQIEKKIENAASKQLNSLKKAYSSITKNNQDLENQVYMEEVSKKIQMQKYQNLQMRLNQSKSENRAMHVKLVANAAKMGMKYRDSESEDKNKDSSLSKLLAGERFEDKFSRKATKEKDINHNDKPYNI